MNEDVSHPYLVDATSILLSLLGAFDGNSDGVKVGLEVGS